MRRENYGEVRDFQRIKCSIPGWYTVPQKGLGGSMLELTEPIKSWVLSTAKQLKGHALRIFMAQTVQALGEGGQRRAERELGWNRGTIRKGMHELESGMACVDAYAVRGRKRSEEHLPP